MQEPFSSEQKEELNEAFDYFISRKDSETSVGSYFSEEEEKDMEQGALEVRRLEENAETRVSSNSSDSSFPGNGILHNKEAGNMENIGNGDGVPFVRDRPDDGDVCINSEQEGALGGTEPTNATRKRKAAVAQETQEAIPDGLEVNGSASNPACHENNKHMETALPSHGCAAMQHATQEEEKEELK